MSIECAECERDLRGGHDPSCSRYVPMDEEGNVISPPQPDALQQARDSLVEVRWCYHDDSHDLKDCPDWIAALDRYASAAVAAEPCYEILCSMTSAVVLEPLTFPRPEGAPVPKTGPEQRVIACGEGRLCPTCLARERLAAARARREAAE